ncbi:signal peptide containing protein [Theileria equi strain WA]|uniref:Signal peptide containing protein n=1 Tax=Theileria equi strain WA TaxID=1537102 RepID=L1LBF6_THEEQ|nr:signal peptide containing protein [Theileria equi strain WA]EKX72666.1 signal peptide containing protein [Theileria equi strain WA]|eukprot:XP_004832118.1 signal peptide containing protein [Theileria equi strain WA]
MNHTSARPISLKLVYLCIILFASPRIVDTLENRHILRANGLHNTHRTAFQTLDLIKIFGRLSEPSLIGNVMATSTSILGKNSQLTWKLLFKNDKEKINVADFKKRLTRIRFKWPKEYMTNKQLPFLIPLKSRSLFKIKCKPIMVNPTLFSEISAGLCTRNYKAVGDHIDAQRIDPESISATFKALSCEEEFLTVEHVLAYINYMSPLMEMVNWNSFISSLPVGPEDIKI